MYRFVTVLKARMRRRPGSRIWATLMATALAVSSCSSGSSAEIDDDSDLVTVFGPWRGVAANNFRTVLSSFEEQTGIRVRYVGSADFESEIVTRAENRDLPDIAVFPQPGLMATLADVGYLLPAPDSVVAASRESFRPEVLEAGSRFGELIGLPIRQNVKSLIWYPPDVFAEQGYTIPRDWGGLQSLVDRMVSDGFTPWCFGVEAFGSSGWPATDWVEDVLLRMSGTAEYDAWVAGDMAFTELPISDAFSIFALLTMSPGGSLGGRSGILNTSTGEAQNPMFESPPRCLMHRQASFNLDNLPSDVTVGPDGDTDVFVMPAIDPEGPIPLLVGGSFAAAMTDRDATWHLMEYLATAEAGEPWAAAGGYVSPHVDFDSTAYSREFDARMDELLDSSEIIRFDASDMMPPQVGTGTFFEAMLMFISNDRLTDALEHAQSGYDLP